MLTLLINTPILHVLIGRCHQTLNIVPNTQFTPLHRKKLIKRSSKSSSIDAWKRVITCINVHAAHKHTHPSYPSRSLTSDTQYCPHHSVHPAASQISSSNVAQNRFLFPKGRSLVCIISICTRYTFLELTSN